MIFYLTTGSILYFWSRLHIRRVWPIWTVRFLLTTIVREKHASWLHHRSCRAQTHDNRTTRCGCRKWKLCTSRKSWRMLSRCDKLFKAGIHNRKVISYTWSYLSMVAKQFFFLVFYSKPNNTLCNNIIRRSIQNLNGSQPLIFPPPNKGALKVFHVKLHLQFRYNRRLWARWPAGESIHFKCILTGKPYCQVM